MRTTVLVNDENGLWWNLSAGVSMKVKSVNRQCKWPCWWTTKLPPLEEQIEESNPGQNFCAGLLVFKWSQWKERLVCVSVTAEKSRWELPILFLRDWFLSTLSVIIISIYMYSLDDYFALHCQINNKSFVSTLFPCLTYVLCVSWNSGKNHRSSF